MTNVYLILAHKKLTQVLRLIKVLCCENSNFVIHLDKSVPLPEVNNFINSINGLPVYVLNNRRASHWGSFELVQATLDGLEYIQDNFSPESRVVLLSGQDYPIKPLVYINSYFNANPDVIFLDYSPLPLPKWEGGGLYRFPFYETISKELKIYAGSQWMSFPVKIISIIFQFLQLNPEFIEYYQFVSVPDESFFQTALLNCNVPEVSQNLRRGNLHLIKWDPPFIHPRIFSERDWNLINKSSSLFARKFDEALFPDILNQVDTNILSIHSPEKIKLRTEKESLFDEAALFLTDKESEKVLDAYRKLSEETKGTLKAFLVYHHTKDKLPETVERFNPFCFDDSILSSLDYKPISKTLVPGNNHFPLLKFFKKYPFYKYYWYIEDDVRYGQSWESFFAYFNTRKINSDFLACHLKTIGEEPGWHWWDSLRHKDNIPAPAIRIRSFNPIYRLSARALSYLDEALLSGWSGHHEILIPTLLYAAGFKVNDFGGEGRFVLRNCESRFYEPAGNDFYGVLKQGSMRYRPVIAKEECVRDWLYHPVKDWSTTD